MPASLRDLQLALFDILKEIDTICKENNIQYSLACGTALGAIRHQGFIPWDDDLDVMFLRPEYEKFLKVAPLLLKEQGYTLQVECSKYWPMQWSKVRKDNTTFLEFNENTIEGLHQGIYIDLFPIDNLSDNKLCAEAQWDFYHILMAKSMRRRGYTTKLIKKKIALAIAPLFPEKPLRNFVMMKNNNGTKKVHCFLGAAVVRSHNVFPRALFDEYQQVLFEGEYFPIVKDYDTYLKICFGDYMQLPPLEKREAHLHALFVDLDKSYSFEQMKAIKQEKLLEKAKG